MYPGGGSVAGVLSQHAKVKKNKKTAQQYQRRAAKCATDGTQMSVYKESAAGLHGVSFVGLAGRQERDAP